MTELKWFGNEPQHCGPTIAHDASGNRFAVVEFDDQGEWFDPGQANDIQKELNALEDKNPIILVFVHGWRHNADPGDSNLKNFQQVYAAIIDAERRDQPQDPRPIFGIFAAWRGLPLAGPPIVEWASFWNRQHTADRVAHGSPRQLFGMLKYFRNGPPGPITPKATLVIIGHSFGARIVYTAIAQSLIESVASGKNVASFGDLVLLVNPAFSAIAYLPIHNIVKHRQFAAGQPPIFVCATALNDRATKVTYPLANASRKLFEATRGPLQHKAMNHTIGHIPEMLTHHLTLDRTTGKVIESPIPNAPANTPFWNVTATKCVIDGHNGIFQVPFRNFVIHLVARTMRRTAPTPPLQPSQA